ncbi:MAG: TatD family hydrolase, partial [Parcubacteria group bacterium]|nr:TatD family hydrolase [Parcubacteria group bacterium]
MLQAPRFIDSHTHVQFAAYQNDTEAVIGRALEAGIWLVNVGTQLDTSKEAIALAEKYPQGVYATVGLHPIHTDKSFHDAQELGEDDAGKGFTSRGEIFDYGAYKELAAHSKVVAIGECGLDHYRMNSSDSKSKQETAFVQHIELAYELKKPLMIHCRQAFPDLIALLRANRSKLPTVPGI